MRGRKNKKKSTLSNGLTNSGINNGLAVNNPIKTLTSNNNNSPNHTSTGNNNNIILDNIKSAGKCIVKQEKETRSNNSPKNHIINHNNINHHSSSNNINHRSSRIKEEVKSEKTRYITDYFTRTKRIPFKTLVQEEEKKIRYHLMNKCDPENVFKIIDFKEKGKGVIVTRTITKGSFICEYAGDLIKISEAKAREKIYEKEKYGCYMYFFDWGNSRWCVDATTPTGRVGRLINHSRKMPNIKTRIFPINNIPHLIFVALRNIEPEEELLYDYGEKNKEAIQAHPWLVSS